MKPVVKLCWWRPQMTGQEIRNIRRVLAANYLNDGDWSDRFAATVARRLGANHGVTFSSGTAALASALMALGVGPGDEVLVPDVTFIATAHAASLCGARVVLVDVREPDLSPDLQDYRRKYNRRTKAIVVVHVSGRGGRIRQITRWARKLGLKLVEDAAEAMGSRKGQKYLGTWGDIGCFSLSPFKTITTGQGGLALTRSRVLARRLRQVKDQGRATRGTGGDDLHPAFGFNFKFTNLQAAVGLAQWKNFDQRIQKQVKIQMWYREGLKDCPGIRLLPFDLAGGEVPLWTDAVAERRDSLVEYLLNRGMECRKFWHPLHRQAVYRGRDVNYPVSSKHAPRALWLPSAFQMKRSEVLTICQAIRSFYRAE